jgi:hypothetical protein
MSILEGDIQFSDKAKGQGRSLRIITDTGLRATITSDIDNPNTKILTLENLGGGGGGGASNGYFPQGW